MVQHLSRSGSLQELHKVKQDEIVKLRCPRCNRFLAEVRDYGKAVCRECGGETTYRSRGERNAKVMQTAS